MDTVKRLWNKNFAILWQGQLISDFGNAIFSVTLGFWVLAATTTPDMPKGDTAMMGVVEACFAISGVILGPFSGTIADRANRKWIIIAADFLRGVLFTAMGAMLLLGIFPFWAIFPLAILSGAGGAFFDPALSSSIPDIVPSESLLKANSARGLSSSLTQLIGTPLAGLLYSILSAPILIFINGFSFLYASVSQLFIKIPPVKRNGEKKRILHDMADGIKYAFGIRGIRTMLLTGMCINFFAVAGMMLMTPLFNNTPEFGKEKYGLVMGAFTAGILIGMLALSLIKVRPVQRAKVFSIALIIMIAAMVPIGLLQSVDFIYPLAVIAGLTNAIVNVLNQTVIQSTVPAHNRGKVFGIIKAIMSGLTPIAMAVSGVAASIFGTRPTMVFSFAVIFAAALPLMIDRHFRDFINTDITEQETANTEEGDAGAQESSAAILTDEN